MFLNNELIEIIVTKVNIRFVLSINVLARDLFIERIVALLP